MTSIVELADLPVSDRHASLAEMPRECEVETEVVPSTKRSDEDAPAGIVLPDLTKYGIPEPVEVFTAHEPFIESRALRGMRMCASFFAFFLAGWNVGATGALLPYIEQTFHIGYAHVSVLFIANFIGYIAAALTTGVLTRTFGFGYAFSIAVVVSLAANAINCSQHINFGLMCFGFFVMGNGFATQLGLGNAYFATLRKPLLFTGFLHGTFGLGAFASPLVATTMAVHGLPYNYFYMTGLGMNIPVQALVWLSFRKLRVLPALPGEEATPESTSRLVTLKSRAVWTLAIFLMLYVGAEDSIGGWIVTYVRDVRHGTPKTASWVASCFYLGIAVGRIALPPLNILLGERRAIFIYLSLALALESIAWAVPLVASTAASTALVGLAISTFYTAAITTGGRLLPRAMHADAFTVICSVGQSGSALFPLLVGLVSAKKGIWIVEPTVIALLGAQGACWYLVPKVQRRID